ncbi:MAG TPA: fumarylacetoacetate hydrolase family protein [Actinomycetes bacterium]|jgi:2-keto-4-pentenoate hydratase|nr:fumarylacetoacetate hydrolase family protein [Actinomycetes bacterium]
MTAPEPDGLPVDWGSGGVAPALPVDELARSLHQARRDRVPVPPLTEARPGLTAAEAYAIQHRLVELLQADGEGDIVGYKLGLTSRPMQQQLGIDQPDYGPVLAAGVHPDGVQVDLDRLIQPKVEAEIAIVLGAPLPGPNCTALDVRLAAAGAVAAVEIIDSRVADWRIRLADTIADLASSAHIVLSSRLVPLDQLDPKLVGVVLTRNGELVATGAGAAALGDPLHAVAWLANTLHPLGATLQAGHVVMTGALHASVPLADGDVFRAEFDVLGPVGLVVVRGRG